MVNTHILRRITSDYFNGKSGTKFLKLWCNEVTELRAYGFKVYCVDPDGYYNVEW